MLLLVCVCFFFYCSLFCLIVAELSLSRSLSQAMSLCVSVRAHGIEIVAHKVLFRAAGIRFSIAHTPTEDETLNTTL